MRHLQAWQKLLLMGAISMVPFAVVTFKMASSVDTLGVEFARREIRGLQYYEPLATLLLDLQRHRDLVAGVNGPAASAGDLPGSRANVEHDVTKVDEVNARLGDGLRATEAWTTLRDGIRDLLDKAPRLLAEESYARHSRLIADAVALIAQVGDASNLTLDPDLGRKHLIEVLIYQGPELSESLSRARGFGRMVAQNRASTPEQSKRLNRDSILVQVLGSKLDESMQKAFELNAAFKADLEADAQSGSDAVVDAMAEIVVLSTNAGGAMAPEPFTALVNRSVDSLFQLEAHITEALHASLDNRVAGLRREIVLTVTGAVFGLLTVSLVGLLAIRDVTRSLRQIVQAANRIAAGEIGDITLSTAVTSRRDEIGVLARAFDQTVAASKSTVSVAERIASGDLAVVVEPRSERDVLGQALADMVKRLSGLVGDVQRSGIQVKTSVNDIAATARQQEATASEIAATTAEIGATAREISATSKKLVVTMYDVAAVADQSATLASTGQGGLTRMAETMGHVMAAAGSINTKLAVLNEKAGNITQVVTTITKVADQTNLLSLNAAIEAEKAGDYGRGFSVVATEIRRLADQTAVATHDIEQTVKEIQSAVSAGVMGMDKFSEEVRRGMEEIQRIGDQLSQVIQHVQALAPRCEAVNEGMQAQATGAEQITEALAQLSQAAEQTVESLRHSTTAIDRLNEAATGMRSGAARFTVAA